MADGLRQPPSTGQPSFAEIGKALAAVETDLEAADVAPTSAQVAVVEAMTAALDSAWSRWTVAKTTQLKPLNEALRRVSRQPIHIPAPKELHVVAPDEGQDLP